LNIKFSSSHITGAARVLGFDIAKIALAAGNGLIPTVRAKVAALGFMVMPYRQAFKIALLLGSHARSVSAILEITKRIDKDAFSKWKRKRQKRP
jgi:hypothetical protein